MGNELIDETNEDAKYKYLLIDILFAVTVAISAILLDTTRLSSFSMGTSAATPKDGMEAVVFLVVWLLYGVAMGSNGRKGFLKFISFYWGIGGAISLTVILGNFIAIPVFIFILAPTYGLGNFISIGSSYFIILCVLHYHGQQVLSGICLLICLIDQVLVRYRINKCRASYVMT